MPKMNPYRVKAHPLAGLFPLLPERELKALADDIRLNGLREAILLTKSGLLLDGRNRLRACKLAGILPRFETYKGKDELSEIISRNIHRRHLNDSQKALLAVQLLPALEKAARVRMRAGKPCGKNSVGSARDIAAKALKVNPHYVSDAKKIVKKFPDLVNPIRNGLINMSEAGQLCKIESVEERAKILRKKASGERCNVRIERQRVRNRSLPQPKLPVGRYELILADPPFSHNDASSSRSTQNSYPTMTLDELKKLDVPSVAAKDCVLFMWASGYFLREGFELMESWGFKYVSQLVWDKEVIGLGHWSRARHENLLIGIKGNPRRPIHIPDSIISERRSRKTSEKPKSVYVLVENMWPRIQMKKLELFARGSLPVGWDGYGNEFERLPVAAKSRAA